MDKISTDLCKDTWVSVKEVLIQHRVIVGESLRQPAQAGGRDLLEGRLVRLKPDADDDDADADGLKPDAAHVEGDPVLAVLHHLQPKMIFGVLDLA